MLVVLDNYDSFTYNLVQYFQELGAEVTVFRNDEISVPDLATMDMSHLVISPGPGRPEQAGISEMAIRHFSGRVPLLGVCLGHQAIGQVFGGRVIHAPTLVHGKTSPIHHDGRGVFKGLPIPFNATRYHSLIVDRVSLPPELEVTATTTDGIIMGLRHTEYSVEGIQFHPESILTEFGKEMLRNFLKVTGGSATR
jgi:anthranilate synthase/aminodeoxychorismate synthase-like glutamine amidotransferase